MKHWKKNHGMADHHLLRLKSKQKRGSLRRNLLIPFLATAGLISAYQVQGTLPDQNSSQTSVLQNKSTYSQPLATVVLESEREPINYTSLVDYVDGVEYTDDRTKGRFQKSMENMEKYNIEPLIDTFCNSFGLRKEEVIPYFINESNMNPNAKTTGGCKGIGQMSNGAVKDANWYFKSKWGVDLELKYGGDTSDQIKSSLAYFAKTFSGLNEKYPNLDRNDLLNLVYFSYNAGPAPVHLSAKRIQREDNYLNWETVKEKITPELLSSSSSDYRGWTSLQRTRKVGIINDYIDDAGAYRGYLDQLTQFDSDKETTEKIITE